MKAQSIPPELPFWSPLVTLGFFDLLGDGEFYFARRRDEKKKLLSTHGRDHTHRLFVVWFGWVFEVTDDDVQKFMAAGRCHRRRG
jgi:hypothetical protein